MEEEIGMDMYTRGQLVFWRVRCVPVEEGRWSNRPPLRSDEDWPTRREVEVVPCDV